MKLLGIDYGQKRVGFAIGETEENTAIDLGAISFSQERDILKKARQIAEEEHIEQIVLGLPLSQSGERLARARQVERFGNALYETCNIPIIFEDERFTSAAFKRIPSRYRQGKSLDALSALLILSGYMDRLRREE